MEPSALRVSFQWVRVIMILMAAIQNKKPYVAPDTRLLTELTGQPIPDVAVDAVRMRQVEEVQRQIAALPRIGVLLTDADLYDADGLPR